MRSATNDRRMWADEFADKTERAAENDRMKVVHSVTTTLVGEKKKQSVAVKDKHGELKTEKQEKLARYVEHFSDVLNREEPSLPAGDGDMAELTRLEEIEMGRIKQSDVKIALKQTKRGKTPGADDVCRLTKSR